MKRNFKIKLIILLTLVLFNGHSVLAASLEINVEKNTLQKGEIFTLPIFLNTEGQYINTLEGTLKYDTNFIQAEAINIGNSFVNLWIDKPNLNTAGVIYFSGITPGGISTRKSEVFQVIFRTKKEGNTDLLLDNVNLFLNDGQGSVASVSITNTSISIKGNSQENMAVLFDDTVSPEKFNIIRTRDISLFDNKYFIAFNTSDKGSGIDYYQVCELFKCISTKSPFLLKNQSPFYRISVRAYDVNGNFTVSTLTSSWLILLLIFALFIVIISLRYFYRRNL